MKTYGPVLFLNFATAVVTGMAFLAPTVAFAQTTSADLRGVVTNAQGEPVAGAEVLIIHVPSGTAATATTSESGQFFTSGLRVGGPYEITTTAEGFMGSQEADIFLQPGSQAPLRISLSTESLELDRVTVTGQQIPLAVQLNNGVGSTFSAQDIANTPTTDRDVIGTLLRDPLAQSDGVGNLSVGGVNPRFNGFSIDGSLQQDDFGLSSGTYASSRSPINLDIIETATLVASDYSVTAQGFTGALVNVITKSGGNEFDGGAFYAYKDDGMVGDEIDGEAFDPGIFEEKEYGVWASGPIIKDKLFFLFSYDEYENAAPVDFSNFDAVNGIQEGFFQTARQAIIDTYGYDPLGRPEVVNVPETSERWYLKLDWNINDFQRLSFSYQDTQENDTSVGGDEFASAWYDTPLEVQAYNVDWFSDWSDAWSTNVRVNYKENTRGQTCRGGPNVGQITLDFEDLAGIAGSPLEGLLTEEGEFIAGCDSFRHANTFADERLQLFGKADWFLGEHTVTFGMEYEDYSVQNLFVANSRGNFTFETYDELVGRAGNVFYSNVPSNNALDGQADWSFDKLTAFVSDRWTITPDFELNFGFRWESYGQSDRPPFSQEFNDLYGVNTTSNLDGKDIFLPRVGFLWTPIDRGALSGGFGLYAGGAPTVWVSNAFQAPVVGAAGDFSGISLDQIPPELLDEVALGTPLPLDYIDEDFDIPSDWKASLRWDQTILDGYQITAQYLYTDVKDGYFWQLVPQLQNQDALPTGVAPDGRIIYADLQALGIPNLTRLGNVDGASSHVLSLGLGKAYDNGIVFDVSYAYTDSEVVSEGTSSRGISNWRGQYTTDQNFPDPRTSPFQVEHSFKFYFGYEHDFWSDNTTRIDIFGRVFRGDTWGTTFDVGSTNPLFGRAGLNENPFDNRPLYVPSGPADPLVVYAADFDVDGFFNYLGENGIPTGGIHAPYSQTTDHWNSIWDLRFQQELGGFNSNFLGRNKFKLIVDIDNFLNLLNDDWGRVVDGVGFGQNRIVQADLVTAADVAANGVDGATALLRDDPRTNCLQATDCVYRFTDFDADPVEFTNRPDSVYEIRVTLRYDF